MPTAAQQRRAQAAIDRAWANAGRQPTDPEDERLGELHPYVTHERARQIRLEAQEDHHAST